MNCSSGIDKAIDQCDSKYPSQMSAIHSHAEIKCQEKNTFLIESWVLKGQFYASIDAISRKSSLYSTALSTHTASFPDNTSCKITPMPVYEEIFVVLFFFLFFSTMLLVPLLFLFLLCTDIFKFIVALIFAFVLSNIPCPLVKSISTSILSDWILKYFSYRGIWTEEIPVNSPCIIVGPPHGVFPFGSILALLSIPRSVGIYVRGLAATAVLSFPIIGNLLKLCGCIDASRNVAKRALQEGHVIGINSGGIAEIFETNAADGVEIAVLKSRGGVCKLALETGANIMPCYVFGNSLAFSVWYDDFGVFSYISRSLRAALCIFWGRFFLPIPYRIPITAVLGNIIKVEKVDNPSKEQIDQLLKRLSDEIVHLFDVHKASYGWKNKVLVIK